MARRMAREPEQDSSEVQNKDFDKARKLYFNDIKPARSKASEFMQEISTAFKAVKKDCGIQPSAMKAAIKLVEMEDAKRDDWLRCFSGVLKSHNISLTPTADLVDIAEQAPAPAPKATRGRPKLVTVPVPPADDSDRANDGFEMSEAELAAQKDRPSVQEAQAQAETQAETAALGDDENF